MSQPAPPPAGPPPPTSAIDAAPPPGRSQDRTRRRAVVEHARNLIVHLDALGRTLKVHDAGNAAVRRALDRIAQDLAHLRETEEEIAFVFAEGHAFVNGVWLRATRQSWEAALLFTDRLAGLKARGLVLGEGVEEETLLGLGRMLREDPDEAAARALPGIKLLPLPSATDRARTRRAEKRDAAVDLFEEGIAVVQRGRLSQLDLYARRRQRALVLSLVQMAEEDLEDLLALSALRDPALRDSAHDLMVCIYSLCIGRALDLPRRELVRLGVAALGHNIGEALVDSELYEAPRALTPSERDLVEQHPLLGFAHLLRAYGFTPGSIDRAVVAAEHHLAWDGSDGYPVPGQQPHLFSRIVAVADVFDALCSDRPHRRGWPPDQAVKQLLRRRAGERLDPVLIRALIRIIGRFPTGSLVELDTGEQAVVLGPGAGLTPLDRPRVLLVTDEDGFDLDRPVAVDLGDRHHRRRAWLRTIARTRDPRRLGRKVVSLLYADRIEHPPTHLDRVVMVDKKRPAPDA